MTLTAKLTNKSSGPHFRIELEFGALVFVEGRKKKNPEKTPWGKVRTNLQQTQPTLRQSLIKITVVWKMVRCAEK